MDKVLIRRNKDKDETPVTQNNPPDLEEEKESRNEVGFQINKPDIGQPCSKKD